ncbi:phosphoribosyl-AMP cyclohydrolase [Pseudoclavibacter alba]|uniref:phosphoribosyl-AMP cyclohydrolase n=1 Tax=Pseudoclavibacter albus TaxID=272241 RepID=UPI0019D2B477|nr:phosphoribosyl-AMP cyclohydrolase [Pseudoclavibacter alba]
MRDVVELSDAEVQEIIDSCTFNADGLIPAVVTAEGSAELLMVAWLNAESLRLTLTTREVTYWSRSRQELWRKGATSGHTQRLIECSLDCDRDVLHLVVEQAGAACHTGTRSCFDGDTFAVRFVASEGTA